MWPAYQAEGGMLHNHTHTHTWKDECVWQHLSSEIKDSYSGIHPVRQSSKERTWQTSAHTRKWGKGSLCMCVCQLAGGGEGASKCLLYCKYVANSICLSLQNLSVFNIKTHMDTSNMTLLCLNKTNSSYIIYHYCICFALMMNDDVSVKWLMDAQFSLSWSESLLKDENTVKHIWCKTRKYSEIQLLFSGRVFISTLLFPV